MLGTFLKAYMRSHGIKQNHVAEEIGVTPQIMGAMLNEQRKIETSEFFGICKAMNADPTELAIQSGIYTTTETKQPVTA